tara:strand:+ start:405 stop:3713 length:3309 start_codon:yes stop_codon:yes gene_type:complete
MSLIVPSQLQYLIEQFKTDKKTPKRPIRNGQFTKKFIKFNRDMVKKGLTQILVEKDKYYDIKTKKFKNIKYDKRYKSKTPIKKLQVGAGVVKDLNKVLENKSIDQYKINLVNKIQNALQFTMKDDLINVGKQIKTFTNSPEIIVDMTKINYKELIELLKPFASKRKFLAQVIGSKNWITLSTSNLKRLTDYDDIKTDLSTRRAGSDNEFIFELLQQPKIKLAFFEPIKEAKKSGGFFKYYHKIKVNNEYVDLSILDIYHERPEKQNIHNCLFMAIQDKLTDKQKNDFYGFVKNGQVPMCNLSKIASKLGISITVNTYYTHKNQKSILYGDKTLPNIKVGLADNHYFKVCKLPFTKYFLENYEDLKDKKDANFIINYRPKKGYERRRKKTMSSPRLVKYLLDNKESFLERIPIADLLETIYHNGEKDNLSLEYDEENNTDINKVTKMDNTDCYKIYYDFETNTTTENHTPYLVCAITQDNKQAHFMGDECGKPFLNWCANLGHKKIMLIAHNARYDYCFIMDYLYGCSPLLKGTRLMSGNASIYNNKSERIEVRLLDSLNLIPTRLRAFTDMFALKSKKEILPYALYTTENIRNVYVPIDECLKEIKKEDQTEYLENAKKWGNVLGDRINIIDYSKEYCYFDCKVLKSGFEKFEIWIKEITELSTINYCSIASLALDYLIKEGCFEGCYKLSGRPRDFIQRFVVGGRVMLSHNEKKIRKGEIADFDAVSEYPSAMFRMEGLLKGKPKILKNKSFEWLKNNSDGFFVKCLCLNEPTIKRAFSVLSIKDEKGIRQFTNNTKGETYYLDKTSYEDAVEHQGLDFKIICGYYYNEGRNDKMKGAIRHLFKARLEAKKNKNPIQAIYKLLMNSSYGKNLLKPIESDIKIVKNSNWEKYLSYNYNFITEFTPLKKGILAKVKKSIGEHFNNVYAGVEILTMSKRILGEVLYTAEDNDIEIFYVDTDSTHMYQKDIPKLRKHFNEKYGRELIGKDMGQFHSDFEMNDCKKVHSNYFIGLGKKCYLDCLVGEDNKGKIKNDYHIRMKGISKVAIEDYSDQHNLKIEEIYEKLYEGDKLEFDLLARGKAIKFKYNKDLSVSSQRKFKRAVCF